MLGLILLTGMPAAGAAEETLREGRDGLGREAIADQAASVDDCVECLHACADAGSSSEGAVMMYHAEELATTFPRGSGGQCNWSHSRNQSETQNFGSAEKEGCFKEREASSCELSSAAQKKND